MISRADAHKLSSYDCEDRPISEVLNSIDKYIYQYASQKKRKLYFAIDMGKYSEKTFKEVIKTLKKNKYKVKIVGRTRTEINTPERIEFVIKWW